MVVVEEDNVYESLDNFDSRKAKTSYSTMTLRKKGKHKSSWNITDNFTITLCTVNRLNCDIKRNPEVCNSSFQKKNFRFILNVLLLDWHSSRFVPWRKNSLSTAKNHRKVNFRKT